MARGYTVGSIGIYKMSHKGRVGEVFGILVHKPSETTPDKVSCPCMSDNLCVVINLDGQMYAGDILGYQEKRPKDDVKSKLHMLAKRYQDVESKMAAYLEAQSKFLNSSDCPTAAPQRPKLAIKSSDIPTIKNEFDFTEEEIKRVGGSGSSVKAVPQSESAIDLVRLLYVTDFTKYPFFVSSTENGARQWSVISPLAAQSEKNKSFMSAAQRYEPARSEVLEALRFPKSFDTFGFLDGITWRMENSWCAAPKPAFKQHLKIWRADGVALTPENVHAVIRDIKNLQNSGYVPPDSVEATLKNMLEITPQCAAKLGGSECKLDINMNARNCIIVYRTIILSNPEKYSFLQKDSKGKWKCDRRDESYDKALSIVSRPFCGRESGGCSAGLKWNSKCYYKGGEVPSFTHELSLSLNHGFVTPDIFKSIRDVAKTYSVITL